MSGVCKIREGVDIREDVPECVGGGVGGLLQKKGWVKARRLGGYN